MMETSENAFSVTGTVLSRKKKTKKPRRSDSIKFRLKYFLLCAIPLVTAIATAGYFEIQCYEQIYLPMGPGLIVVPLKIVEACAWIYVVTCIICMVMVMLKCHNGAATTAGQLYFVVAIMAVAAATFYMNVHDRYNKILEKIQFKPLTDELKTNGALATSKNYKHLLARKIDVQFYYFIDKFQRDQKCCGLHEYGEWLDDNTQDFLHVNLSDACFPHTDRGKREKGSYPTPFQCKPIFKDAAQKFPKSCCKPNSDVKQCIESDTSMAKGLVFDKACNKTLGKILDTCYPSVIIPAAVSPILAIYLTCVLWAFTRYAINATFLAGCCFCDSTPKSQLPQESSDRFSIMTKMITSVPSRRFRIKSEMIKNPAHPKFSTLTQTPPSSPNNERASVPVNPKGSIKPKLDTKQQNVGKVNENQVKPQAPNQPTEPPKPQRASGLSSGSAEGTNPRPNPKLR